MAISILFKSTSVWNFHWILYSTFFTIFPLRSSKVRGRHTFYHCSNEYLTKYVLSLSIFLRVYYYFISFMLYLIHSIVGREPGNLVLRHSIKTFPFSIFRQILQPLMCRVEELNSAFASFPTRRHDNIKYFIAQSGNWTHHRRINNTRFVSLRHNGCSQIYYNVLCIHSVVFEFLLRADTESMISGVARHTAKH